MVYCRDFHQLNLTSAEICNFIRNVSSCHGNSALMPYTEILYCQFSDYIGLGVFLLVLWCLLLFLILMVTSDQFLCQALLVIVKTLHLSQNVAGVTFLAFGNGAPDIFSAIAAVKNTKDGDAGLAFGALFGAGLFVTTVVAGVISIIKPFKLMERPFLRDIIFYIIALFSAFYVLWKKTITRLQALFFILLYVVYACIVIISRYINMRMKNGEKSPLIDSEESSQSDNSEENIKKFCEAVKNVELDSGSAEKQELLSQDENRNCFKDFLRAINIFELFDWTDAKWYSKTIDCIQAPLIFIQLLTMPLVDPEYPNKRWNRHLNTLQLITGSVFFTFAINLHHTYIGHLPVLVLTLLIGFVLAAIVFFTSTNTAPKYYPVFGFFSFLMSVLWIYVVANEVVNLLITFGIFFNMSNVVIGVTFLAWGNSLGDLITDITIAKNNNPRTGISAVYGGQMFNLLLGIGIPFTISTWSQHQDFELTVSFKDVILAAFLAFNLVTTFILMPIFKFKMNRYFGFYLISLYVIFSIFILLIEISVIPSPII